MTQKEPWRAKTVERGQNETELLRIRYTGSQVYGGISVNANGIILFEHGATSGAAVPDTDTALDDGALGYMDLSADVSNIFGGNRRINASSNWESERPTSTGFASGRSRARWAPSNPARPGVRPRNPTPKRSGSHSSKGRWPSSRPS